MCCSASHCLYIFYSFFCSWVLVLLHCGQTVCRGLFGFPYICWDLLCALGCVIFWRKFHGLLRRMYIVLLQGAILCGHLSGPLGLWCFSILEFLYWLFCLGDLSIGNRWVLKSPTATVLGSTCDFKSISVCSMKLGALMLSTYKLKTDISSWGIAPFISMKWVSFLVPSD
jgi:hypothetical protein